MPVDDGYFRDLDFLKASGLTKRQWLNLKLHRWFYEQGVYKDDDPRGVGCGITDEWSVQQEARPRFAFGQVSERDDPERASSSA